MKVEEMKNKDEEVMTTKDGKVLYKYKFEEGDTFIPQWNKVNERRTEYTDAKGDHKVAVSYNIKCIVQNKEGNKLNDQYGNEEIFVDLTPTQAKTLNKKADEGIELNQNIFVCYTYQSKEHGTQLGVGLKNTKKPKTFEDFETEE